MSSAVRRRRNRNGAAAVFLVTLLIVLGGLAWTGIRGTQGGTTEDSGEGFNWQSPLMNGKAVASSQAGAAALNFQPLVPGVANPRIMVNDSAVPLDVRGIAYAYNDPKYGTFDVLEQPAETTESDLEGLVQYNNDPDNPGTQFTVETLADGRTAVLEEGAVTVSLRWIQQGIDTTIVGPTGSFSASDAITIAGETGSQRAAGGG